MIKPRSNKVEIEKLVLKDIFENEIQTFSDTKQVKIGEMKIGDYLIDVYIGGKVDKTIYFNIN